MYIYTIGFTKKSAKDFFELIIKHNINVVIDIRLNNKSQLAGFSKGDDLKYFLDKICCCSYLHCIEFAPTSEILDAYKNKNISWNIYVDKYLELLNYRNINFDFLEKYNNGNICLLCSESSPDFCHRRLLAELMIKDRNNYVIKHI